MAQFRLDLNNYRRIGTVILEYDSSESLVITSQTTRLVVGSSAKGPFNRPIFVDNVKTARAIFGEIDTALEKRGSFFHRSLEVCLQRGPVFALNLLPLNNSAVEDGGDAVKYRSFSVDTTEANGALTTNLYSGFYNQEQFWKPDEEYFLSIVDSNTLNEGKLLNIVNLGQTPMSLIIRKANKNGIKKFNVTAREWYSMKNEKIPSFVNEWDYISDYFVDVYAIYGDWTDYDKLAIDPIYSKYFSTKGLLKTKLNDFMNATGVTIVASFEALCLIPDFNDGNNVNYSIDTIINQQSATLGLFVAINRESLFDYDPKTSTHLVDVVGHHLADSSLRGTSIDFLSYNTAITELLTYTENAPAAGFTPTTYTPDSSQLNSDSVYFTFENAHTGGDAGYFRNVLVVEKPASTVTTGFTLADYTEIKESLVIGSSAIQMVGSNIWGKVTSFSEVTVSNVTYLKIAYTNPLKATEPTTDDLVIKSITTTTGAMALTIDGDVTSTISDGDDILVEHPTNGLWYYLLVNDTLTYNSGTDDTTVPIADSTDIGSISTSFIAKVGLGGVINNDVNSDGSLNISFTPDSFIFDSALTPDAFVAWEYSQAYIDFESGILTSGDKYYRNTTETDAYYIGISRVTDSNGFKTIHLKLYSDESLETVVTSVSPGFNNYKKDTDDSLIAAGATKLAIYSLAGNINDLVELVSYDANKTTFSINGVDVNNIEVGQFVVYETTDSDGDTVIGLTKITSKLKVVDSDTGDITYKYTVNQPIKVIGSDSEIEYVERFIPIDDFVTTYDFTNLPGFKLTSYHLPGDKTNRVSQLEKILGVLDPANSNLRNALSNKDVISFRYIVDTFSGGLSTNSSPKNQLSLLAQSIQTSMAIINPPSVQEFIDSTDPRFTDVPTATSPKPILQTEYIVSGGNLSLGPSFTYSLPDTDNGAKHAAFYLPYLTIREKGRTFNMPPAAHVSNCFVKKHVEGNPYVITAGAENGVISDTAFQIVGLEYDFIPDDQEKLASFGINPILRKRNLGYLIYGNSTSYQRVRSALNNVHVRDLLITLEGEISTILDRYIFKFNNAETRSEIRNIVTAYMDTVRTNGGVDNFQVIINEDNNTNDIIDANTAIIDIFVDPPNGIHTFISRYIITKNGGVSTGGFTQA